ncbi:MAG TPA: hypothetical protein VFB50_23770 [Chloroflexota bacterium]|nr:hypothetical protein [Chloroflexota bacterium]
MPRGKSDQSRRLIQAAIRILTDIQPCGVRAVCYQLFVERLTPSMAKPVTNEVGRHLGDARDADLFDWHWIVDNTRVTREAGTWASFGALLDTAQRKYRYDRWQLQPRRCMVWSEKDTVFGTLEPVLDGYGVRYQALHGHASDTKIREHCEASWDLDEPLKVFYVGDYDVAGMDMSERDLRNRIHRYRGNIDLQRIALTHADTLDLGRRLGYPAADKGPRVEGGRQIRGDLRYPWYVATYGDWCWELDALNPNVLRQRVEDAITSLIDWPAWERADRVDAAERSAGEAFVAEWEHFRRHFGGAPLPESRCAPDANSMGVAESGT